MGYVRKAMGPENNELLNNEEKVQDTWLKIIIK